MSGLEGVIIPRRALQRLYQQAKDAHEMNVVVRTTGKHLKVRIGKVEISIGEVAKK